MKTRLNFTIDELTKLKCPEGTKKHLRFKDTRVQGLALRVTPAGAKAYIYYRRMPDNNESARKICEIMIGKFEDVKLDQARHKATEFNFIVGKGKDPSLKPEAPLTYGILFQKYIDEYARLHTATWQHAVYNHKRYFVQWHNKPLASIKREHVQHWLNVLAAETGKHTANRNFNTLRAVITWGIGKGLLTRENPCSGIRTFKTQARERFIQPGEEYFKFADALNEESNTTIRDLFWMCLFTGARLSNVLAMKWSQINMHLMQWTIPMTKNGNSQTIPLTRNAMHILTDRRSSPNAHDQWVFPTDRKGWKTGEMGHLVSVRKAFNRIVERAGITNLRIHDLRRTAGSYMAIQNVSPTIIGKALGHRSLQATAIYARLTQDPVRQAMESAQTSLTEQRAFMSLSLDD